ncbi:MAG: hypothetical protein KDC24_04520 [Saprospiraceae bacterium]|nr:hypothetical protein [Saprospiraceae bacterium]
MKNRMLFVAVILVAFLLSSCQRKYTWVYTNHTPTFFEKRNDFEIGGSISELAQAHVAYAITDNFGIRFNGAFGRRDSFDTFTTAPNGFGFQEKGASFYTDLEFAAGYSKKLHPNWVFETYGGIAWVNAREKGIRINQLTQEEISYTNPKEFKYNRFFIQPAIGKVGSYIDYGAGVRFSLIDYYDDITDVMAEPFVFGRWGFEYLKFMTQASIRLNSRYGSHEYRVWPVSFGVGINFVFHPSIHDKKPLKD